MSVRGWQVRDLQTLNQGIRRFERTDFLTYVSETRNVYFIMRVRWLNRGVNANDPGRSR